MNGTNRGAITYRYALDSSGRTVDIAELTPTTRNARAPYRCFGCGSQLTPRLGRVRARHFKHEVAECSRETYIHSLAKHRFFEIYSDCLDSDRPFFLELEAPTQCATHRDLLGVTPCIETETRRFDLTKYFRQVSLEAPFEGLRPDVLLRSDTHDDQLFVEIAVTHKCEDEKINRGFKIIEIEVNSEEDLDTFSDRLVSQGDWRVSLFGFEPSSVESETCSGACKRDIRLFLVYRSGKAILTERPLADSVELLKSSNLIRGESLGVDTKRSESGSDAILFVEMVRDAWFDGLAIKNCFNCRHHGLNWGKQPVFCKLMAVGVASSNFASECTSYSGFANRVEAAQVDEGNLAYQKRRAYLRARNSVSVPCARLPALAEELSPTRVEGRSAPAEGGVLDDPASESRRTSFERAARAVEGWRNREANKARSDLVREIPVASEWATSPADTDVPSPESKS